MNNKQEEHFLAIEFASSGVKVVKLKEAAGAFELLAARTVSLPLEKEHQPAESFWKKAVLELIAQEKLESYRFLLSINDAQTCFSQFVLPKIPKKELAGTLKWKMKDDMPYPAEEAVLDYRLFEPVEKAKKGHHPVLAAALPRSVIDRFYQLLPAGQSEFFSFGFVPFSISSLRNTFALAEQQLVVVVDIGHSITEIAFYAGTRLSFLRKIAVGSLALTQSLTQPLLSERGSVALTLEEAELAKREEILLDASSQKLVAGKIEASKLFALIRPELEKLTREIERSLDYYAQEHGSTATRVFLTGGGSRLNGLNKFLEQTLEMPVSAVDLAQDMVVPERFQKEGLAPYYRLITLVLDRKDFPGSNFLRMIDSAERLVRPISYAKGAIIAFLIYLVLAGGIALRYFETLHKTEGLRRQIANLKLGFEEAQKIQTLESQINRGVLLSSAILATEPYWDEVFREMAQVFPERVVLTDVSYNDEAFVLRGKVMSTDRGVSVAKLLLAMEGPIFQKVTLVNTEQGKDSVSFTVRAKLSQR